jgi:membrane protein
VGLLLFLYLLNQVVLFAAALTATSDYGEAVDLASGAGRRGSVTDADQHQ